jgi:NAD(P)-dependent dehydrogenase (short-subunit alcohol dehydrogenase family)
VSGRLSGLVAVVNGAGRGIGRAIAVEFAREGSSVVVNDIGAVQDGGRDPARAFRVVDEIRAQGGEAIADIGDIGDADQAASMINKAVATYGKLDILVNCAGIGHIGTVVDTEPEDFDAIMRVHVRGYFNTTRVAAQHWVERGEYGRLINFVSMAAVVSHPSLFAYSTAKSAIVGMTRSCANALVSYGVTANCIRPNAATGMTDAMTPEGRELFRRSRGAASDSAIGTLTDPAHVAPMVVYLASRSAAHVSGRFVEARGGFYALWEEPRREQAFEGDFLADPDGVYTGIGKMLSGISVRDLKMPMPPLSSIPGWKTRYGSRVPTWDFAGFDETSAKITPSCRQQ